MEGCAGLGQRARSVLASLCAARGGPALGRLRSSRAARALALTILGAAYGLAGYLAIERLEVASLFLVYALDAVPIAAGLACSPWAGAWVGATGSAATGALLFREALASDALRPYVLALVAASAAAGALIGWLPARLAPALEPGRLRLALLACALAVGAVEVVPVLTGRLVGRSYVVNLWVWPAMSALAFAVYALVAAPLVRAWLRRERAGLVQAAAVVAAALALAAAGRGAVELPGPERFEPLVDPSEPAVAALASELAPPALPPAERANATYRFVRDNVTYLSDPPIVGDYIQSPAETIARGYGDCEDKAILLASLLRAEGFGAAVDVVPGHARVRLDWNQTTVVLDPTGAAEFVPPAGRG